MVDSTARRAALVGAVASAPPAWAAVAATAPELATLIVLQSRMIVGLHLLYGGDLEPEERALEIVAGLASGAGLSVGRRLTVRLAEELASEARGEGAGSLVRARRAAPRRRGVGGAQLRRGAGGGPGGRRARGAKVGSAGDPGQRPGSRRPGADRVTRSLAPADVVVAGGGLAAAALALELARRDLTVDLLAGARGAGVPSAPGGPVAAQATVEAVPEALADLALLSRHLFSDWLSAPRGGDGASLRVRRTWRDDRRPRRRRGSPPGPRPRRATVPGDPLRGPRARRGAGARARSFGIAPGRVLLSPRRGGEVRPRGPRPRAGGTCRGREGPRGERRAGGGSRGRAGRRGRDDGGAPAGRVRRPRGPGRTGPGRRCTAPPVCRHPPAVAAAGRRVRSRPADAAPAIAGRLPGPPSRRLDPRPRKAGAGSPDDLPERGVRGGAPCRRSSASFRRPPAGCSSRRERAERSRRPTAFR